MYGPGVDSVTRQILFSDAIRSRVCPCLCVGNRICCFKLKASSLLLCDALEASVCTAFIWAAFA